MRGKAPGTESTKLAPLTSLRFLAAAAVVADHAAAEGLIGDGWLAWTLPGQAVSVFFVLSGFVLQWSYGGDLRGLGVRAFVASRIARIWPLHAAVVIAALLLVPQWAHSGSPLAVITLTHAWSSDADTYFWAGSGPSWSLSTELFFYLAFPFITLPVRRHPVLAAMAAILFVVAYAAILHPGDQPARFAAFYIDPLARLPEFILGMCAAEAMPGVLRLRPARWVWTPLEIGALAGLIGLNILLAIRVDGIARLLGANAAEWARGAGCAPAAVTVIMVLAAGRGAVSRVMCWRGLVILGESSFALYIVHGPLTLLQFPGGISQYLVLVAACTALGHLAIERPIMAAVKRLVGRPQPAAMPPP